MGDAPTDSSGEIEPGVHAFVVRVWRVEGQRAAWRGHVTHVGGGERCYVTSLRQIDNFIGLYLRDLGVRPPLRWRIRQWLGRSIWP
ncbi:MAG TPA: hypothetical protein PLO33_08540 [Kouleothrix sp.]|uniref:hypothetical protein n=1 Tax=Kouleothrix sp. TaxID=2779161 RepID=UPI002C2A2970|nr:hypothetical protein [Kouleothrix sp.]HRC75713.1 hypothetical protein [Kouleothrix sp.]